MQIETLPADQAAVLVPLLQQVHAIHVAERPDLYRAGATSVEMATFLQTWLAQDTVTALIAGPAQQPHGYAIFEIETRAPSVLRLGQRRAMVHHICVDQAHRRTGIGKALMARLQTLALQANATHIATVFGAFNTTSGALMRSAGLEPLQILSDIKLK